MLTYTTRASFTTGNTPEIVETSHQVSTAKPSAKPDPYLLNVPRNGGYTPGQPVPMLDHPFNEEAFPNIQLEAISSHPVACKLGEETSPHLGPASFQVIVGRGKVPTRASFSSD